MKLKNSVNNNLEFDVVIVGGGLVGKILAATLKDTNIKFAIIDKNSILTEEGNKAIALNFASRFFFEQQNMFSSIKKNATLLKYVNASEVGKWGRMYFDCESLDVDALAWIVPENILNKTFSDLIEDKNNIFDNYDILKLEYIDDNFYKLKIKNNQQKNKIITSKLLIAADGAKSYVRDKLNIKNNIYNSSSNTALLLNVTVDKTHNNGSSLRFFESGSIACLPIATKTYKIVVCSNKRKIDEIFNFDDVQLIQWIYNHIGYHFGAFNKIKNKMQFPLLQSQAELLVKDKAVLIGNAATNLHPIAAQGLNLAIRDVEVLSKLLIEYFDNPQNDESKIKNLLQEYQLNRIEDHQNTFVRSQKLLRIFKDNKGFKASMRHIVMSMLDIMPQVKTKLFEQFSGVG